MLEFDIKVKINLDKMREILATEPNEDLRAEYLAELETYSEEEIRDAYVTDLAEFYWEEIGDGILTVELA